MAVSGKTKAAEYHLIQSSRNCLLKAPKCSNGIPEKLDSGRMVLTLGLWTLGCLNSGRLHSGHLDTWTLNP